MPLSPAASSSAGARSSRRARSRHGADVPDVVLPFAHLSTSTLLRSSLFHSARTPVSRALSRRFLGSVRCHATQAASTPSRNKVGAVIIGNEILSGNTIDTNLSTLAKHVESHGAVLQKAVTIRDDVDIIADAVRSMSRSHDLVFTSGGIGPTLDDVTYAGVAAAFSLSLSSHEQTLVRMKVTQPNMELNPARLRMAELPHGCETLWTDGLWVPLAVVHNVYVLPGIPKLFARMLASVPDERFGGAVRRERMVVLCEMAEGDLAQLLQNVQDEYENISLGSYPATTEEARSRYQSMITLEGDVKQDVMAAAEVVREGVNGEFA